MKKRILSIVLAVLMLVSVLPVTAMAADGTTDTGATAEQTKAVSAENADKSVHVNKSISDDGTKLTLEAFATNTVSTETTYDPLDIVLVLDVSGSMVDYKITSYKYTETKKDAWSCNDIYNSSVYYYYKDSEGNYRRVSWDDEGGIIRPYRCWITAGGTRIGDKVRNRNDVSYRGKLYTRKNEGTVTRMEAMQAAVNAFIDNVAAQKDSEGNVVKNHISIVKFAGKMQTPDQYKVGNDTYESGRYTYNYSQIVKGMTDVSTGSAALKEAVNSLQAGGATSADYGMQLASHVLSQHKDDPVRKSVVIMFTDGEPNHTSDFDDDVAKDAIAAAKGLKDKKTVVFTIGIFNGAKPSASVTSNSTSDTNKYMHAVSSNYPNAAYIKTEGFWSDSWDWSFGERAKDSNYYLAASNAAELEDIFVEISKEVNSLTAKIDEKSVLSDTLSDMFTFDAPEGTAKDAIKVYTQKVKSFDEATKTYTWEDKVEATNVSVDVQGKTLKVKGFDYGTNAVTTTEGSTELKGYKLVVTIPIKPDTSCKDWQQDEHYYDTNASAALSYGENNSQKLELTDSPEAPVTGYKVEYEFTGDAPTGVNKPTDNKGYIAGQKVTAKSLEQPTVTDETGTWTFNGWKPEGEQTFDDKDITFTGAWTFKEADKPGLNVTKTAELLNEDGTTSDLPEKVAVGDKIKYTVKVKNTGNVALTDIKVEDTFNGKGTLKDAQNVDVTLSEGNEFTIDVGTLATTEEKTYTYTYEVVADDAGMEISNSAVATSGGTTSGDDTEIPVKNQYTVSYKFVSGTEGRELPDNIKNTAPSSHVENEGAVVTPSTDFTAVNVTGGTWQFASWDEASKTVNADTKFTGTWTFVEANKFSVTYKFEDEAPKSPAAPVVSETFYANEKYTVLGILTSSETKNAAGETGEWTFNGWKLNGTDVTSKEIEITGNTEIVGTWTFKKTEQPPQTEYKIELPISKTLRVRSGSHPGTRTFWFDVSYYAGDNVFRHAGEFSITLPNGWDHINETVTVTVNKDAYDAILGRALVCVEERDLSENGFEYDTTPRFGRFDYIIITDSGIVGNLPNVPGGNAPMINPKDDSNFNFVNYYGKSGKVEKPAKVSPQLNRDDHVAYIMGYPDGKVRPEGEITRAEACTIFFRLLTKESRDYYFSRTNDYTDVSRTDWFNNAISTLSNAGIVTGYADGTFRPDQPITRGEMAKIIANFARLGGATKSFTDLSGHWAKSYVELAAGNGWIAGYPDGTFGPDKKITRAETVTMINRVLERVPAKESRLLSRSVMLTFPDNEPGEWYYIAVQEASNSHTYQRSAYETAGDEMWLRLIENVDWTKLEK